MNVLRDNAGGQRKGRTAVALAITVAVGTGCSGPGDLAEVAPSWGKSTKVTLASGVKGIQNGSGTLKLGSKNHNCYIDLEDAKVPGHTLINLHIEGEGLERDGSQNYYAVDSKPELGQTHKIPLTISTNLAVDDKTVQINKDGKKVDAIATASVIWEIRATQKSQDPAANVFVQGRFTDKNGKELAPWTDCYQEGRDLYGLGTDLGTQHADTDNHLQALSEPTGLPERWFETNAVDRAVARGDLELSLTPASIGGGWGL